MSFRLRASSLAVPALLAASLASPAEDVGGLLGWVEDTRGAPLAGAVISLFGKGVGAAGLVTLSDSSGRFSLPTLPPGSYTLRALRDGHLPSAARQITVLPDRQLRFTVSLTPEAQDAAAAEPAPGEEDEAAAQAQQSRRELTWLLRHKRRSVLEERQGGPASESLELPPAAAWAQWVPPLGATIELVTHPERVGLGEELLDSEGLSTSLSVLRLEGRLSDTGSWSLGGLLSESGSMSWRMAAEFVLEAGEHEIRAGSGYGTRLLRPTVERGPGRDEHVGAIFVQDRWQASDSLSATIGGRFSHVGFLDRRNTLDPSVTVELKPTGQTAVRVSAARETMAPGGDLLTLSTLATAPSIAMAVMDDHLRAQRALRLAVEVEETLGPATLRAYTFYEGVQDHLGNAFAPGAGPRRLRIFNAGRLSARGMGVTIARRFGNAVSGSMSYTYGHGWRHAAVVLPAEVVAHRVLTFEQGDFHDIVARLETVIAASDTRLAAFYRLNSLIPQGLDEKTVTSSRFDVQLSQGLPFLGELTHADWDLLLAVRNLYYEADEGTRLDEVAVINPPKRVLGGIAVRF